jgi:HAD superfamily hydrolase (TIGR01509 family)
MSGPAHGHGRSLQAVLWDMDGTLVDTEPVWIAAEHELAARHGTTWDHGHALELVGRDLLSSGRYIRDHMRLDLTPAEVVDALLDRVVDVVEEGGVEWRPGARELLAEQRSAGVPAALVTMSYRRLAEAVVSGLPAGTFDAVVVGDEVANGKPHPEAYETAARMLGVDTRCTVAIEDSAPGAASARAAGCHVLVVPHHVDVPTGPGRTVRRSLGDVRLDDVAALLGASSCTPDASRASPRSSSRC